MFEKFVEWFWLWTDIFCYGDFECGIGWWKGSARWFSFPSTEQRYDGVIYSGGRLGPFWFSFSY